MIKNERSGFTLLETMVAVFVLTVGATAAYILASQASTYMSTTHNQAVASYLSQEGVEIVRNIRDGNLRKMSGQDGPRELNHSQWLRGISGCDDVSGCTVQYNESALSNSRQSSELKLSDDGFYTYGGGSGMGFQRTIWIDEINEDSVMVTVDVEWQDRGEHRISTSTELYHWFSIFD